VAKTLKALVTMTLRSLMTLVFLASFAGLGKAPAHEFWIEPQSYLLAPDAKIRADLRVGQDFNGSLIRYFKHHTERFQVARGDTLHEVSGRIGDAPALNIPPVGEGLLIAVHQTAPERLTYREWDQFENFVRHKGYPELTEAHETRGLPRTGFHEEYQRFAKSLIAAGDGKGQDQRFGLATEIVLLSNPYRDDLSAGLPVQVWLEDGPKPGAQVEVFARAEDGSVSVRIYQADPRGIAIIPVQPGFEYLVDSVTVRPRTPVDSDTDAVWESLWASTTFAVLRP